MSDDDYDELMTAENRARWKEYHENQKKDYEKNGDNYDNE